MYTWLNFEEQFPENQFFMPQFAVQIHYHLYCYSKQNMKTVELILFTNKLLHSLHIPSLYCT